MFYRFVVSRYVLSWADIEDILSTFYMKFWKVVDRYNDEYAFDTYMWTVFRNTVKDWFKKQKLWVLPETYEIQDPDEDEESILDGIDQDFMMEDILWAMADLDELSYEIVFLRFIEDKTYEEISWLLNISQDAVRQRISRSLKKLKGSLQKY
jgi:RNA polymerase sigma-70 factor (ECF subfamily)